MDTEQVDKMNVPAPAQPPLPTPASPLQGEGVWGVSPGLQWPSKYKSLLSLHFQSGSSGALATAHSALLSPTPSPFKAPEA